MASGTATPPAAQTPAVYICRVAGLCREANANTELLNLLKGMCVRRSVFDENEYGLEFPLQSGTKAGHFKMIKMVPTTGALVPLGPTPPTVWRLVHESAPLRGTPWNNLPATVLEITESALTGIYAVQFMHSMGCQQKYRVQRRNNMFVCVHEDYEVQVSVFSVHARTADPSQPGQPLFEGSAVEARIPGPLEQQVEAAKALGQFCQKLLPYVVLKRVAV